jgi:CRP-like cAMP-binding protein
VSSASFEGEVVEVTWRATKMRTRQGNLVIVPNSEIAKQAITNYSEPAAPTRVTLDVGASYRNPPNEVKAAILEVLAHEPAVLAAPRADVLLVEFASSSITYRVRFWITDPAADDLVRDRLRTAIYYMFARRSIEIPFPIQVQYERVEEPETEAERADRVQRVLSRATLFNPLSTDERRELAHLARERFFGDGEAIVRESTPGESAFVVMAGMVRVTIGSDQHEVARIREGGYFGEMSLLTGDPRTATVSAAGDCRVVEITAAAFREIALENPAVLEAISTEVARRRAELESARTAAASTVPVPEQAATLLSRVRRFLLGASTPART